MLCCLYLKKHNIYALHIYTRLFSVTLGTDHFKYDIRFHFLTFDLIIKSSSIFSPIFQAYCSFILLLFLFGNIFIFKLNLIPLPI